jgi:hypothetical protein
MVAAQFGHYNSKTAPENSEIMAWWYSNKTLFTKMAPI